MAFRLVCGSEVFAALEIRSVNLLEELVAAVDSGVVLVPESLRVEVGDIHREAVETRSLHSIVGARPARVAAVPENLADHLECAVLRPAAYCLRGAPQEHIVGGGQRFVHILRSPVEILFHLVHRRHEIQRLFAGDERSERKDGQYDMFQKCIFHISTILKESVQSVQFKNVQFNPGRVRQVQNETFTPNETVRGLG